MLRRHFFAICYSNQYRLHNFNHVNYYDYRMNVIILFKSNLFKNPHEV